jgi:NAD(P)-dependent dehydrogenase (short-subunit alcohol dehydrogenase family)
MTMEKDLFSLEGKVALVTGASGAIGRDISMSLAGAGADLILVGRNAERLRETALMVEKKGRKTHTIMADLSKPNDIARIVQESKDQFQGADILVNNAATNVFKKAEKFTEEDFDLIFTTNLKGPFNLSQQLFEIMKSNGGGSIVFVVSQLGQTAMNYACLYGATKAALMQITRSLAFEWAEHNIRVNSVSPGPWSTGMLAPVFKDGVTEEALTRMTPSGRLGGEGDIGGAVIFLVSEAARHITGQDVIVDGGFSICKIV